MSADNERSPTFVRYMVLAWLCAAAAIAYICRNSIAVAENTIRTALGLSDFEIVGITLTPKDQMGYAMSAFFVTYAIFQLPTGWLGHRLGTRKALPIFAVLWSVFTAWLGLASGFVSLMLARLGGGMAQAGIFPCCTNTTAKWFPTTGRGFASGALGSFMSVGGALGAVLTGYLLWLFEQQEFLDFCQRVGVVRMVGVPDWRWVFLLFSIPGMAWAIWFYVWFRDYPDEHRSVNVEELAIIYENAAPPARSEHEPTPWRQILTSRAMWWICGQQFCRAAGYIFFASWFATYLQETRHVNTAESGVLTSLPLLAVVVGSLLGGRVSDLIMERTGSVRLSRQVLAAVTQAICGLLVLVSYPISQAWLAVMVISMGAFFSAVAGPCGYTITIDLGGRHVTTVFSMMNMSGNIGAIVFPAMAPRLVALTGDWDLVLLAFAGFYFAAAICWACLDPREKVAD
ncbi:MAG: MFS transporter [Gemmatales bacterium]|nr:MAG: MFS transporter [Gemmatales bacterium]